MVDTNILKAVTLSINEKYQIDINHFNAYGNCNLFNEMEYFQLHSTSLDDLYFQLVRISDGKVYATIAFYKIDGNSFVSPKRGTFGGFVFNEYVEMQLIEMFIYTTKEYLIKMGAHMIYIKCPPFSHYFSLSSVVMNILFRQGFSLSGHELNYDMAIDERLFIDRIDHGNRKRILKCIRAGMIAEQVNSIDYPKVYRVIEENRLRRGFPMTMSLAQIGEMVKVFPEKMHFFAVYRDSERSVILAAAVCVALTDSILYVLYWGDVSGVESYSPIALLASDIYVFCQKYGFKVLDVGISTISGEPNLGLVKFKHNLGFVESIKLSFVWEN